MTAYLLSGLVFGRIESYAMEHGFKIGEMDFYGFKAAWHGAMLALALTVGIGTQSLDGIFWWILVEDLSFWASSKWLGLYKYKLTEDSWIAKKLGSIKYKRVLIPLVHPALFLVGLLTVYLSDKYFGAFVQWATSLFIECYNYVL